MASKEYYENNKEKYKKWRKKWKENNKEQSDDILKKWRENNKEHLKEYSKKRYNDKKDEIKEKKKKWREDNKEYIKEYRRKYTKERLKNDIKFKLIQSIRNRINQSFKRNGFRINSRTNEILGCSYEEFKIYLENKFTDGMNWNNQGKWHLDHIIPVSICESEEEIIELNHYTNFQPLWSDDNLKKSNKIIDIEKYEIYERS